MTVPAPPPPVRVSGPAALLVALVLATSAVPASSQDRPGAPSGQPGRAPLTVPPTLEAAESGPVALARADALYRRLDAAGSLEVAERAAAADPTDYGALWRAARAALVLGVLAEEEDVQDRWFLRAGEHAERAVALRPDGVDGLYWLGAARGRLALQQGPRTTAELAQQVWDLAHRILAIDPGHPGAHNILGKLNYEVMTLTALERFLARLILGNEALRSASWERAEHHHARSVAADPDVILFHFDRAQMWLARDRPEAARRALHAVLSLPPSHPPDPKWQAEARRMLAELEGRDARGGPQ